MSQELINTITEMREDEALQMTDDLLKRGTDPMVILDSSREAMQVVGERFKNGQYFVPELILAGEILKGITEKLKPYLTKESQEEKIGKVVIGTVEGDVHDIGKDIVTFMLEANGFEVQDLGVDVPSSKFVESVREFKPQVVGLSGFLTLAYEPMKETVESIKEAGFNDVKIMIGGGQIDEQICVYVGADAYGRDAMTAVTLAKNWLGGK